MTTNPTTLPIPLPVRAVERARDASCLLECGDSDKNYLGFVVPCDLSRAQQIADALNACKWVVRNADGSWPSEPQRGQVISVMEWSHAGGRYLPNWVSYWEPGYSEYEGFKAGGRPQFAAWSPIPELPEFKVEGVKS